MQPQPGYNPETAYPQQPMYGGAQQQPMMVQQQPIMVQQQPMYGTAQPQVVYATAGPGQPPPQVVYMQEEEPQKCCTLECGKFCWKKNAFYS